MNKRVLRFLTLLSSLTVLLLAVTAPLLTTGCSAPVRAMPGGYHTSIRLTPRGGYFTIEDACEFANYRFELDVTTNCDPSLPRQLEVALDLGDQPDANNTTIFLSWEDMDLSRIPQPGECVRTYAICVPNPDNEPYTLCWSGKQTIWHYQLLPLVFKEKPEVKPPTPR